MPGGNTLGTCRRAAFPGLIGLVAGKFGLLGLFAGHDVLGRGFLRLPGTRYEGDGASVSAFSNCGSARV